MSSSHTQFHPSSSTNDQDEVIARRKSEQKRRFQQKQGNTHTNVDSLMQTMFSDLKLQPKTTMQNSSGKENYFRPFSEFFYFRIKKISNANFRYSSSFYFYLLKIILFSIRIKK
jgi:hypothetical protein